MNLLQACKEKEANLRERNDSEEGNWRSSSTNNPALEMGLRCLQTNIRTSLSVAKLNAHCNETHQLRSDCTA